MLYRGIESVICRPEDSLLRWELIWAETYAYRTVGRGYWEWERWVAQIGLVVIVTDKGWSYFSFEIMSCVQHWVALSRTHVSAISPCCWFSNFKGRPAFEATHIWTTLHHSTSLPTQLASTIFYVCILQFAHHRANISFTEPHLIQLSANTRSVFSNAFAVSNSPEHSPQLHGASSVLSIMILD